MRRPITAKRRERGRRRALIMPMVSAALGVVLLVFGLNAAEGRAVGVVAGILLIALALFRFLLLRKFLNKTNFYGGPGPELAEGETVLWNERASDSQKSYGSGGGLTLTNRRLVYVRVPDEIVPDAKPREWPISAIASVSAEGVVPVEYPGDWGGTLVFDVGEEKPQRFRVFDPVASAALIKTAVADNRAGTQKGPTT